MMYKLLRLTSISSSLIPHTHPTHQSHRNGGRPWHLLALPTTSAQSPPCPVPLPHTTHCAQRGLPQRGPLVGHRRRRPAASAAPQGFPDPRQHRRHGGHGDLASDWKWENVKLLVHGNWHTFISRRVGFHLYIHNIHGLNKKLAVIGSLFWSFLACLDFLVDFFVKFRSFQAKQSSVGFATSMSPYDSSHPINQKYPSYIIIPQKSSNHNLFLKESLILQSTKKQGLAPHSIPPIQIHHFV